MEPVDQPVVQVFSVGGTEAKGLRIKKKLFAIHTHDKIPDSHVKKKKRKIHLLKRSCKKRLFLR